MTRSTGRRAVTSAGARGRPPYLTVSVPVMFGWTSHTNG